MAYSWSLPDIMAARDDQMRGSFARPVRLAASMRTDDALYVARSNRLAPQRCIEVEIVPVKGARGKGVASEAEAIFGAKGVGVSVETLADINGCLVDHGVAFATNVLTPRDDGTRVDIQVHYWPIEHVKWNSSKQCYVTRVGSATDERASYSTEEEEITHGDGRWIIFSTHEHEPFKQEAAVLPAALVWARRAFALRDWAKSSVAHGSAKVVGEMPEGVALQDANGLTPEATAMATLLRSIVTDDAPAGIRPAGSKVDFLTNNSTAWQIWTTLVESADKSAARIYLGQDGTLGTNGGAPGVDIGALMGVANTLVQSDLGAIERGLFTGSIEVWTAINWGSSDLAPTRRYMIPDADAEADRSAVIARRTSFFLDLQAARDGGFVVDQKYVDELAKTYDVDPPTLPEMPPVPAAVVPPAETPPSAALRSVR
ncbi:MAG TPA: DUF935 family protein [Gemmatimonadaceae bacterium]|nr:DUF935 family protein [Gemmatimonadaceae bacterium]